MPNLRPFDIDIRPAIRLAVASLILAIGLRTWLVIGLIEPVTVAGSSMVPTLQGGDRLWIDRTALLWRHPERWEIVVARNPSDASELCIKRIVGLPGERVALRDGDVLIDGAVVVKSVDEQLALRQWVYCTSQNRLKMPAFSAAGTLPQDSGIDSYSEAGEGASDGRWQPEVATRWRLDGSVWRHRAQPSDGIDWLCYEHPRSEPITDDVTLNLGLTRRLNLVDEFMFAAELHARGNGSLRLAIDDGTATAEVTLRLPEGELTVVESKRHSFVVQMSARSRERLLRGEVQLEFTNFDQQLLLVIDGRVELRRPWPRTTAAGTARPVSIGAQGLDVQLTDLTLYRDIYHSSHAVGTPPPLSARWQLGPDEYFLLGDNSPVSLDSRLWGPVPRSLLIGKPLLGGR